MSAATRLRSLIGALKAAPDTRRRPVVLERDHQVLLEAVRRDEAQLAEIAQLPAQVQALDEMVGRLHQTIVDADPQMALDIVTAVRDDVRRLLVEVTEQQNRIAAAQG